MLMLMMFGVWCCGFVYMGYGSLSVCMHHIMSSRGNRNGDAEGQPL